MRMKTRQVNVSLCFGPSIVHESWACEPWLGYQHQLLKEVSVFTRSAHTCAVALNFIEYEHQRSQILRVFSPETWLEQRFLKLLRYMLWLLETIALAFGLAYRQIEFVTQNIANRCFFHQHGWFHTLNAVGPVKTTRFCHQNGRYHTLNGKRHRQHMPSYKYACAAIIVVQVCIKIETNGRVCHVSSLFFPFQHFLQQSWPWLIQQRCFHYFTLHFACYQRL